MKWNIDRAVCTMHRFERVSLADTDTVVIWCLGEIPWRHEG